MNVQTKLEAAQQRRYALVAKMEDAHHKMSVAERNGAGIDPADAQAFEDARQAVLACDVELRELSAEATRSLPSGAVDAHAASGMPDAAASFSASFARSMQPAGSIDVSPLFRSLQASQDRTTGKIVLRTLLQGVSAGNLTRTTDDMGLVATGLYGAVPLVLAVQVVPTGGASIAWQRIEPNSAPATGGKQATEGGAKTAVALKSVPKSSILATYTAYEKVSVQALDDQAGLLQAMEAILRGAVLRAADADAWTTFLAESTAVTADADPIVTIVKTAAKVAKAGGTAIRAVVSPEDYADMMLRKADTAGSWMGLPPGVQLPAIVQSSGIPAGKLLVTSATDGAFTAMRQSIEAMVGLDGGDFLTNMRSVLVEGRMVSHVRNAELSYAGNLVTL
jgi:hypothetical protein